MSPVRPLVYGSAVEVHGGPSARPRDTAQQRLVSTLGEGAARLVAAIQDLSLARDLDTVMRIVRHAARELTGADGATFVLRDGDMCFYADEEAIAPLWKGSRFPMSACISGWAMLNKRSVVIEDIYADPRIPADAYRPTFVKSLAMVPIRAVDPIGAIGNYWAERRAPTEEQVGLLQALANSTSIAMENVSLYADLERRVRDRTAELEFANRELESFSHAVSHDLRQPLQGVLGYSELLLAEGATLDARQRSRVEEIATAAQRMSALVADLLRLSETAHVGIHRQRADLSAMAREVLAELARAAPARTVTVSVEEGLVAEGDAGLLRVALANLLGNAWKFTTRTPDARIEFGGRPGPDGARAYFVRDNGPGFDTKRAQDMFHAFRRLHSATEFPGTGIGLATVKRVIDRHGGRVGAECRPGEGATFWFTLG